MTKLDGAHGFWGLPTATIDWCEENYEITHYIAEFWNTISNLIMIVLPLYGIYWSLKIRQKYKQDEKLNKNGVRHHHYYIPNTLIYCQIGLLLIGIGSWLFHMTLLYTMQLFDEIPMIWSVGIILYTNFDLCVTIFDDGEKKSSFTSEKMKNYAFMCITVYCICVSYIYVFHYKNPLFHEITYSILIFLTIGIALINTFKLKLSPRLFLLSFFYQLFGFFLWTMDNKMCGYLKQYRSAIDSYLTDLSTNSFSSIFINGLLVLLKSLSEFHSLWHLLTGYSGYLAILFLMDAHFEHTSKVLKTNLRQHHHYPIKSNMKKFIYSLNKNTLKQHDSAEWISSKSNEKHL